MNFSSLNDVVRARRDSFQIGNYDTMSHAECVRLFGLFVSTRGGRGSITLLPSSFNGGFLASTDSNSRSLFNDRSSLLPSLELHCIGATEQSKNHYIRDLFSRVDKGLRLHADEIIPEPEVTFDPETDVCNLYAYVMVCLRQNKRADKTEVVRSFVRAYADQGYPLVAIPFGNGCAFTSKEAFVTCFATMVDSTNVRSYRLDELGLLASYQIGTPVYQFFSLRGERTQAITCEREFPFLLPREMRAACNRIGPDLNSKHGEIW